MLSYISLLWLPVKLNIFYFLFCESPPTPSCLMVIVAAMRSAPRPPATAGALDWGPQMEHSEIPGLLMLRSHTPLMGCFLPMAECGVHWGYWGRATPRRNRTPLLSESDSSMPFGPSLRLEAVYTLSLHLWWPSQARLPPDSLSHKLFS